MDDVLSLRQTLTLEVIESLRFKEEYSVLSNIDGMKVVHLEALQRGGSVLAGHRCPRSVVPSMHQVVNFQVVMLGVYCVDLPLLHMI